MATVVLSINSVPDKEHSPVEHRWKRMWADYEYPDMKWALEESKKASEARQASKEAQEKALNASKEHVEREIAWQKAKRMDAELRKEGAYFNWKDAAGSVPPSAVGVPIPRAAFRAASSPASAGAGIKNDGNTCYFNGSMQAFAHIPGFIATLDRMSLDTDYQTASCIVFLQELQKLMHRLRDNSPETPTTGTVCMTALRKLLEVQNKLGALYNFRAGEMNDASELMRYVVDELQECTHPPEMRDGREVTWTPLPTIDDEEMLEFNLTQSGIRKIDAAYDLALSRVNPLTALFMTFYVETKTYLPNATGAEKVPGLKPSTEIYMAVKLPKIQTVGAEFPTDIESYIEYSNYLRLKGIEEDNATPKTLLAFQQRNAQSRPVKLEDCLDDYFSREKITDAIPEEFTVDTTENSIWQLPQILMLTLTREGYVNFSDAYTDVDGTQVEATGEYFVDKRPVLFSRKEPLDMRPYVHPKSPVLQQGQPTTYTLRSVVIRTGQNQSSGHVTAMCRTGDTWTYYNDDRVTREAGPPPAAEGAWEEAFKIPVSTSAQVLVYVRD